MPEDPGAIVEKRRGERMKGRAICIACGVASSTGGAARPELPYRILRGGMHVGNLNLRNEDHLCPFCFAHGQVKPRTPV